MFTKEITSLWYECFNTKPDEKVVTRLDDVVTKKFLLACHSDSAMNQIVKSLGTDHDAMAEKVVDYGNTWLLYISPEYVHMVVHEINPSSTLTYEEAVKLADHMTTSAYHFLELYTSSSTDFERANIISDMCDILHYS